jgi:2-polyprenyl-3-methyl-5-hydroxy-6-metoxy-1,4-benzoquinol methylase
MKNKLDDFLIAYQGNNVYDFDNQIVLNWYSKRVIELTNKSDKILELGLGHGFSTIKFMNHFENHSVIEGSKKVIENFKSNNATDNVKIEKFESNEKFDVIILGFILEHVDDPVLILKRFKKLLNKNGKIFVSVPNAEVLNRRVGYYSGLLNNITEFSKNDHLLGHQRYYTINTLKNDINSAGLSINKFEGIFLKPLSTKQLISLNLDKKIIDAYCKIGIDYPELSVGILAELKL